MFTKINHLIDRSISSIGGFLMVYPGPSHSESQCGLPPNASPPCRACPGYTANSTDRCRGMTRHAGPFFGSLVRPDHPERPVPADCEPASRRSAGNNRCCTSRCTIPRHFPTCRTGRNRSPGIGQQARPRDSHPHHHPGRENAPERCWP